ncbi:unnamed protein product, partial [Prorocentrum cordatum]
MLAYRGLGGDAPQELETLRAMEDKTGWLPEQHGSALAERRLHHGRSAGDVDSAPLRSTLFGSRRPQSSRELDGKERELRRRDREDAPPAKLQLEVSESSFAARMRARRAGGGGEDADAAVACQLKAILNKLTLEKYDVLSKHLLEVPMETAAHVELLITEVFETAVTQHPFIEMYTDLCVLLHDHFSKTPVADDSFSFKRLLLNECQNSFERNKDPPKGLDQMEEEERVIAEFKYKNRKLGNVKFIGALLGRRMLSSKVFLTIVEELIADETDESLESVATILTIAGPLFDVKDWAHYSTINAQFAQLQKILSTSAIAPRTRCLLKDVLDMRRRGWRDHRVKQVEAPTTLKQVHDKASKARSACWWGPRGAVLGLAWAVLWASVVWRPSVASGPAVARK